ncbi:MAG TPA: hypothetical protein VIO60_01025, partial [Rectinemataceae bacterium]
RGNLFFLLHEDSDSGLAGSLGGLNVQPSEPLVLPGSGLVPNKSLVRVSGEPGMSLRYRTDGLAPQASDPLWPAAGIKVSTTDLPSMKLSVAAFDTQGRSSPPAYREYRLRSTSFFVMIEGNLSLKSQGSALETRAMIESGSNGASDTPISSLWFRLRVQKAGRVGLSWADADDDPQAYTARVKVSVVESDLYTEVPCPDGTIASERRGGFSAPLEMVLQPGDYYVNVVDIDGLSGRSFGLSAFSY